MTVRLGAIGLGDLGHIEVDTYAAMDGVEIVAGADVSASQRERFARDFDVPVYESGEVLLTEHAETLDAVTIVTPHTLHYGQAMACLERDLHVFLEKPMTTDVAEAVDLVETANQRDLVLQVGYQRHFHPAFEEIKRLVDAGRIGDVHMASCYLGQDWIDQFQTKWRANPDLSGGGQLYDSGSHLLDALLWTTESTPESVAALLDYRDHGVDVNSALSVTLDRAGRRITASVGISADGSGSSPEEGIFIWGTDGRLAYGSGELTVVENKTQPYTTRFDEGIDFRTLVRKKLESFVTAVRGEHDSVVPGEFGLRVTSLTEAAYAAYENQTVIDVPDYVEQVVDRN